MADTTALPWLALRPERSVSLQPSRRWLQRAAPWARSQRSHGTIGGQDTFVNLGARDGLADDPLQFLLRDERFVVDALAVEMDPKHLGGAGSRGCGAEGVRAAQGEPATCAAAVLAGGLPTTCSRYGSGR